MKSCTFIALAALLGTTLMGHRMPTLHGQETQDDTGAEVSDNAAIQETNTGELPEYKELLGEWVLLEKELQDKRSEFLLASIQNQRILRAEYNNLLRKANEVLVSLRQAAMDAYLRAPNEDEDLLRLLTGILVNDASQDNDREAFELAEMLIQHDVEEYYLESARNAARLSPRSREIIDEIMIRKQQAAAGVLLPQVRIVIGDAEGNEKGTVMLELFEEEAPNTVANFISLIESGFYTEKGNTFHRVIDNFMAQGGCPNGDGSGDNGYKIADEIDNPDHRKHFTGSVSMALSPNTPDSAGSQFFLNFARTSHLDGVHTVFGRVMEGQDVVDQLTRRTPGDPDAADPDRIISIEVVQKRDHDYVPVKISDDAAESSGDNEASEDDGAQDGDQ